MVPLKSMNGNPNILCARISLGIEVWYLVFVLENSKIAVGCFLDACVFVVSLHVFIFLNG